ncbi:MAG: hypothetical protein HC836_45000 [Richelia sp. RM2_1_2]|nr:hypothetical protein [Richelia sp. RM2_1_2]
MPAISVAPPVGGSTEAKQDDIITELQGIESAVLTDTQLRASPIDVTGPLTDTELRATPVTTNPSLPRVATVTISTLSTNVTGTAFALFSSASCTHLEIINLTGTTIEYQRGGSGSAFPIPSGSSRLIVGITNANQIGIRRVDQSATVVSITAEIFA